MVATGEPQKCIALRLNISRATVSVHMHSLQRKLGARSAAHAVALAVQAGLVQVPEVAAQA
jgi:DNA-binding CsgD family transcriptional regulator